MKTNKISYSKDYKFLLENNTLYIVDIKTNKIINTVLNINNIISSYKYKEFIIKQENKYYLIINNKISKKILLDFNTNIKEINLLITDDDFKILNLIILDENNKFYNIAYCKKNKKVKITDVNKVITTEEYAIILINDLFSYNIIDVNLINNFKNVNTELLNEIVKLLNIKYEIEIKTSTLIKKYYDINKIESYNDLKLILPYEIKLLTLEEIYKIISNLHAVYWM